MSTAPAVAVTAPRRLVDGRERVTLNTAYVRALESAGLVPLAVPTMLAADRAGAALAAVRGLVLTGGEDVAPERYGAAPHPRLGEVDPVRDAAELALIQAARARRLERTLGTRAATVNSRHHQAIRDLAPGLKAVAWADDGVIEGAEPASPNEGWIVAVQWHPEDLTERALFEGFAQAIA